MRFPALLFPACNRRIALLLFRIPLAATYLVFLVLLLLSASQPAHAQWVFDHYVQSVTTVGKATPPDNTKQDNGTSLTGDNISVRDTITPYFRWTGASGKTTTLYAGIIAQAMSVNAPTKDEQASDGLGDASFLMSTDGKLSGIMSIGGRTIRIPARRLKSNACIALSPITIASSVTNAINGYVQVWLKARVAPSPDFSITAHNVSIRPGGVLTTAFGLTSNGSFSGNIDTSTSQLDNIDINMDAKHVKLTEDCSLSDGLILTAQSNAKPGYRLFSITGTANGIKHSINITLTVENPDGALPPWNPPLSISTDSESNTLNKTQQTGSQHSSAIPPIYTPEGPLALY